MISFAETPMSSPALTAERPAWPPDYGIWTGCDGCQAVWRMSQERFCHCAECHRSFASDTAFDAHRVGPYEPVGLRTCQDPDLRRFEVRDGIWHWRGTLPAELRGRRQEARKGAPAAVHTPEPLPGL